MAGKKRHFGSIRKLPSGRYQARYRGPDGVLRSAPNTFARKEEATRWLTLAEAQITRQEWTAPERGKVTVTAYGERWIAQRPNLRPRTVGLYRWILGKHVTPYIGHVPLGALETPMVRDWRSRLLAEGVSHSSAAKAYRLLRAILNTAVVEDEIIRKNPCRIPGADQEKTAERPTLTLRQVFALADRVPERYRALILVTVFGSLRWGEVSALQRRDVDPVAGRVDVRHAFTEERGKGLVIGPPKSRAGRRAVTLPAAVLPALAAHLGTHVKDSPDAFVFTTDTGRPIWRGNFNKLVDWRKNVAAIGAAGLHFHDLRHTGNTFASKTGASLRDLMTRMGHDSPRAALIYQHATSDADRAIAAAVDAVLTREGYGTKPDDGSRGDEDADGAAGVLAPA